MQTEEPMTREWLEANGFERHELFGYRRHLSDGPGGSKLALTIGNYPFNAPCCALVLDGYAVVTNACCRADVLTLVRLFEGGRVDHPDIA